MKHLFACAAYGAGFAVSIAGMLNGYGLTIQSWPWVIGGSLGAIVLFGIGAAIVGG